MQAAMDLLLISYGGTLPCCHTSMDVERGAYMTTQDSVFYTLCGFQGIRFKLPSPIGQLYGEIYDGVPFPKIQISLKRDLYTKHSEVLL